MIGSAMIQSVKRSDILMKGSMIMALIFILSLVSWFCGHAALNPFATLLGLTACPFFFWMGRLQARHSDSG
jgi:hypothetical protein